MPEFHNDWFTPNIPFLTEMLSGLKGKPNLSALEIGCFDGRSTTWFMDNVLTGDGCSIDCIDHFLGARDIVNVPMELTEARFRKNMEPYGGRVRLFCCESSRALRKLDLGFKDFIYVDGSHTARDTLSDAVLSWELLKTGGIMVFDDYGWGQEREPWDRPCTAINAFMACYSREMELIKSGYQVALRKQHNAI